MIAAAILVAVWVGVAGLLHWALIGQARPAWFALNLLWPLVPVCLVLAIAWAAIGWAIEPARRRAIGLVKRWRA
ncbi:MAG: hypothetical protein HEQ22_03395 [Sphingopyxis sp.]|uniref:hypothetical protein n=1 Tax=Sphingopyxis sp. TaxID=1908224 RepID=UPI003D80CFDC